MSKRTTVGVAHSDADLGRPAEHSREQLDLVKGMIRDIADQTMGGMKNIVKAGDKVLIKINTVIPCPADAGFTTDPRMLEALIERYARRARRTVGRLPGRPRRRRHLGPGVRRLQRHGGPDGAADRRDPIRQYECRLDGR